MLKSLGCMLFIAGSVCAAAQSSPMLPTGDPAKWRANPDGGNAPAVSQSEPCEGRAALRFAYKNERGYGNSLLDNVSLPPDAYGVRFKLFVEEAKPDSAMHLWLLEKDGDMWMCAIVPEDGRGISGLKGTWRSLFVPFSSMNYQPRGDKKRAFLSADRLLLGFNFADQAVRIADLAFAFREGGAPPVSTPSPAAVPVDPPGRRIAILREPTFERQPGHADPERLGQLLRSAGFSPVFLRAADLCDAARFSRKTADLVVMPCAPFFPQAAAKNFRDFLKAGGAFFSIGGYAFDRLCAYSATGWTAEALWPLAREIDNARRDTGQLNTRYGTPGDTMKLNPDQIGVFDPSFLLRNVAAVTTAPDQYVVPEKWRAEIALEGPAAIAMTGNNSPVFPDVNGRWIPLLETADRLGRPRGPAAALVLNHRGPYAGSNWGFVGVTNRNLFSGDFPVVDRLFVAACQRLLAPAYLVTLKSGFACYKPGETVTLSAAVRTPPGAAAPTVRFRIGGSVVAEVAVKDGAAAAAWPLPPGRTDFLEYSAELLADGQPIDVLRSGVTVWNAARAAEGPAVLLRDNYFNFNGRPLFFGGANTTGMMWYSDGEDPLVWRRDFERMGDFAMNTLRILHFSPFCNETNPTVRGSAFDLAKRPEKLCRQTDAMVQLAQPNQVSIFLSLHDWIPLDLPSEELAAQKAWNRFWAGRYSIFPGMMYDIQNEPGTVLGNVAALRPLYEGWLSERYGSLPAALAAWQASGAKPEIDFSARAAGWNDLRVRDNERFRAWVYARWQRANGEAVRSVAPNAPVTVGHLQTLTASEKVLDTAGVDFINVHHYGAVDNLRGVLKLIDRRFEGKSFSLGEFGSKVAHSARTNGSWGDPAEASVCHYLAVGHYALGMGASFTANWSWKDFRDSVFPWGVNHADLTPKPVLEAYRNMMLLFRTAEPRYEPPRLFLVLPDSFRFGAETARIHEALRRSADWLLAANVAFGVINEESLDRLPAEAQALVWPMAVCPSDAAFERVAQFVAKGGRLLLSGDPRFDDSRTPTRRARLSMLGIEPEAKEPEPPFLHKVLPPEVPFVVLQNRRVCWSPLPVELLDAAGTAGPGLYRRFLDEVSGVARIKASVDDGSVLIFDVALRNGRALTAVNMAATARQVDIPAHAGYPAIRASLAAGRTLYVMLDPEGRVTAAAAQGGLTVDGADVLAGDGDCAFLALDAKDLRQSEQVVALPFGPGRFALSRAKDAARLTGEVGEFRAGAWVVLEQQALVSEGTALCGSADAATAYDLRLLTSADRIGAARDNVGRLLRIRPLNNP